MLAFVFHCLFFLLHQSIPAATAYSPTDYFLLNCGSSSNTTFKDRNWDTDEHLKFLPPNINEISSAATALEQGPSVDQVPYMTARIFHSQFTYTFPLSPGPKFLRLYFYRVAYSGLNKTQAFFNVTANAYKLLSNFSGFPQGDSLFREFIVNVKDNQMLNLTFSPFQNSYSFVNGIEIVSMPKDLYLKERSPKSVDQQSPFPIDILTTAFETLYRLNVGGQDVPAVHDTGMFREWSRDDDFMVSFRGSPRDSNVTIKYTAKTPNYTAPEIVYATARAMGEYADKFRLTWNFTVDPGFLYLLRLHFCEIQPLNVSTQNQRVFTILINNKTAEPSFDVMYQSNGNGIPIFRDYVAWVPPPSAGLPRRRDLWLALFPNMASTPDFADAILNGLEIFKLNSSDGNLAGPNAELPVIPDTSTPNQKKSSKPWTAFYAIIGGVVGGVAVLLILAFWIFRRRKRSKDLEKSAYTSSRHQLSMSSRSTKTIGGSTLPSDLCRSFLLEELKSATADFHDNFVIGRGGFGKVYKGHIDNGATKVAVKRLNPSSRQGVHEFTNEIEMLSKLRHLHLVSLIGYCDEQGEMILVYDYMANGTLRDHLYNTKKSPMPWKQRLQICIGAAKGLQYLHGGAKHKIIHRDVKSSNILLDGKWVAKVSDFGLSKMGPTSGTHVSTAVKGSIGYVDPEYFKRQQLTEKSDVYSFGVVLLEVLCARPAIITNIDKAEVNLEEWARRNYTNGSLAEIVDPSLKGEISPECMRSYAEIAFRCLKDRGTERPAMNDVVWSLEFALQLQEAAEKNGDLNSENLQHPPLFGGQEVTTTDEELFSVSGELGAKSNGSATTTSRSDGIQPETVFSEIMNPAGR